MMFIKRLLVLRVSRYADTLNFGSRKERVHTIDMKFFPFFDDEDDTILIIYSF